MDLLLDKKLIDFHLVLEGGEEPWVGDVVLELFGVLDEGLVARCGLVGPPNVAP